ncbi:MAG: SCO family protein [Pirellulaceae bacterium]|nr:SCO family protein [Pirellulaceae bacterium]
MSPTIRTTTVRCLGRAVGVVVALQVNAWCGIAFGQSMQDQSPLGDDLPANAANIKVEDRVGDFLPLELSFRDDQGRAVRLSHFFDNGKPVVLTLNYSDCPGLCMAQLENMVETLRTSDAAGLGTDYQMISVSIDPREDYHKAARTKAKYTGLLPGTRADAGWHFLVGNQPEITSLAKALGYYYTYDAANDRFNHPAVTYFVSSQGRICRYLVDLGIEPDQFRLAVGEAAEGKLTRSLADVFVQFCYYYDPQANRYSADARRVMALGGAAFAVLLLGCTAPFWFSSKKEPTSTPQHVSQVGATDPTNQPT